jgi:hypothetical protein
MYIYRMCMDLVWLHDVPLIVRDLPEFTRVPIKESQHRGFRTHAVISLSDAEVLRLKQILL